MLSAIQKLKNDLQKQFPSLSLGSEIPPIKFTPTGNVGMDYLLGGGLPSGQLIELWGQTHVGKSTLALAMAKCVQAEGKFVYILDSEHCITPGYLSRAGIDQNLCFVLKASSLDRALEFYQTVLRDPEKYQCGAFIFDTIAALQPEASTEKISDKADSHLMASAARMWSNHRSILIDLAASAGVTVICVNHEMATLTMYGPATARPGGKTIPQSSSLHIHIKGTGKKLHDDVAKLPDYEGCSVEVTVEKSRFGSNKFVTFLDLKADGSGYDPYSPVVRLCKMYGIAEGDNRNYSNIPSGKDFSEITKVQGFSGFYNYLKDNENGQSCIEYLRLKILDAALSTDK